ncbi:hypothetical protein CR513_41954, partial [Mucuna pruriens]
MACTIDFRCLDEGFGGKTYKRKREQQAESHNDADAAIITTDGASLMDTDDAVPPPAKRSALPSSDNPDKPSFGRPSYDGVIAGRVSGRKWKQARQRRASAAQVSRKGTTFEQREREKAIKKAYKERMTELKEEIRLNKVEKRKKREEREKKKKENILRSGTKFQKITNPNTLKKIAKSKQRKQLRITLMAAWQSLQARRFFITNMGDPFGVLISAKAMAMRSVMLDLHRLLRCWHKWLSQHLFRLFAFRQIALGHLHGVPSEHNPRSGLSMELNCDEPDLQKSYLPPQICHI